MKRILRSWQETLRSVGEGLGLRSKIPATERYHAFIAYSWSDVSLASAVQVGLERLAKPWYRTRALRVFRDSTGLPAGPGLRKSLQAALDSSDYLILIASRASATSEHVRREVEHWQGAKGVANLLIGLADGDLEWSEERGDYSDGSWTVLPESLRGVFAEEALHVDFTNIEPKELTLDHKEFRDAVRLLAAGPHGMVPADLAGLEVAERRRTTRYARSAGLILVALTILAIAAGVVAVIQRDNAIDQSRVALSRQIAAEAEGVRTTQPDLALLLGVQALRTAETAEARSSLLGSLLAESRIVRVLYGPRSPVLAMAYVGTGDSELITVHQDGEVIDWDTRRGTGRQIARLGPIAEALVANSIAAVLRSTGRLDVYQLSSSAPRAAPTRLFSASPRVRCEPRKLSACYEGLLNAMSTDGRWLVTDLEGTHLELWEVEQRKLAPRQPPSYLGAPAVINEFTEHLVAVRHHYVNSATEPNAPPDELLNWPLEGGQPRVVARLAHPQALDGPLVVEDSESRALVAAELQNLLTFTHAHPSQTRPLVTTEPSGEDADIVSLLPIIDEIVYLDSSGTVGVIDSLNHTNSRIVSQLDTLVEQAHGASIQHRLATSVDPPELAVAGGSQGVLLLNSPDLNNGSWLLAGTPLGHQLDETPEHFSQQSPSSLPVFSPDGSVLAATTDGSEGLALWRADTGATVAAFESGYGSSPIRIAKISVAPNDHTVAFITKPRVAIEPRASEAPPPGISFKGSVRIWDWRAASHPRVLAIPFTPGDGPTAVAFADEDPQQLVVGTGLGQLYFWNLRTGTQWRAPIRLPLTTPAPVLLLGTDESGSLLVVAGEHMLILDERTGLVTPAPSPKGAIADALSPSGQLAAGIDGVGNVKIWATESGRAVPGELLAPSYLGAVTSLTLGDGLLAFTSSKAVTLYNTATLRKVGQVEVSTGVPQVAFSPTRQALAVVNGIEGSVLAIDPKSLISRACAIANRELTRVEWAQYVGSALPYSATCSVGAG